MIIALIVIISLVLFVILCKSLEDTIARVLWRQRKDDERISQLETNEFRQEKKLKKLDAEVRELGEDVGWHDDNRRTQKLKLPDSTDD